MRSLGIQCLQRPLRLERCFQPKQGFSLPNGLPQGFEILPTVGTHEHTSLRLISEGVRSWNGILSLYSRQQVGQAFRNGRFEKKRMSVFHLPDRNATRSPMKCQMPCEQSRRQSYWICRVERDSPRDGRPACLISSSF